jgi:hypothetical protein
VYPLKMLDTGSIGSDPFSLRRTPTHALGGNAFLQTFVLAALPVQSLRMLDVGLGTILVAGLLWFYMARLGLTTLAAAFVMFVFLAIPPPVINITAVLIPTSLFISLFLIFEATERDIPSVPRSVLIGLHVAALCALKTSLAPAALAFLGAGWAHTMWRSPFKRDALIVGLMWCVAAGVSILPWLLASYRWTGMLVPGSLTAYHADVTRVNAFRAVTGWRFVLEHLKELPRLPYLYVATVAAGLLLTPSRARVPGAFWSLLAAAAIGTLAVTVSVAGSVSDIYRFMYAFVISALIVALIQAIAASTAVHRTRTRRLGVAVLSVATVLLVLSTALRSLDLYRFNLLTLRSALRGDQLIAPALAAKYLNLQHALPENVVLLEHMDYPFLFDFRRNRIWLDDLPGSASPAPGQPFFAGAEALANYLVSTGVRYVAYDYATEADAPRKMLAALADDDLHPSAQAVVRLTFDFHDNLLELGRTRRRIFDDGTAFALDLLAPARDRSRVN